MCQSVNWIRGRIAKQRKTFSDTRTRLSVEMVSSAKCVKTFGWEGEYKSRIASARETELKLLWREAALFCFTYVIFKYLIAE